MGLDSIDRAARRLCIGGSDAKVIMGSDHKALIQLWKEKRGEAQPDDFSWNIPAQLGNATEDLNVRLFEHEHPMLNVVNRQSALLHKKFPFIGCTLDGIVEPVAALFESKFALPWNFTIEGAIEKHWWQLQHGMMVLGTNRAFLSIVTGGGQYHCAEVAASAADQALLLDAERKFWFCVEDGLEPVLVNAAAPTIAPAAVKIVNMRGSNLWASSAGVWLETKEAHVLHEAAKAALKDIMPKDAKEARGHGIRGKRSKAGAITFEEFEEEEVFDVA